VVSAAWAWLVNAIGTALSIAILAGILTLAGIGALICYSLCVVSGRAAQREEDEMGWRRS